MIIIVIINGEWFYLLYFSALTLMPLNSMRLIHVWEVDQLQGPITPKWYDPEQNSLWNGTFVVVCYWTEWIQSHKNVSPVL